MRIRKLFLHHQFFCEVSCWGVDDGDVQAWLPAVDAEDTGVAFALLLHHTAPLQVVDLYAFDVERREDLHLLCGWIGEKHHKLSRRSVNALCVAAARRRVADVDDYAVAPFAVDYAVVVAHGADIDHIVRAGVDVHYLSHLYRAVDDCPLLRRRSRWTVAYLPVLVVAVRVPQHYHPVGVGLGYAEVLNLGAYILRWTVVKGGIHFNNRKIKHKMVRRQIMP